MLGRGPCDHTASAVVGDENRRLVSTVVVTGAAGGLGRRFVANLLGDSSVERIVAVDRLGFSATPKAVPDSRIIPVRADFSTTDLHEACAGADVLVHLAFLEDTEWNRSATEHRNVGGARRLFDAAAAGGVSHVVCVSSAMVYGAWANNPVPLTESNALRPNPELAYAVQRAQVEHLLAEWVAGDPGRTAAVLRPCIALGESGTSWIANSLAAAAGTTLAEDDLPVQFLHLDDLVSAVDLARRARLDGCFNVAPNGWIPGETVRALAGAPPRVKFPSSISLPWAQLRWRFQRGPIPPGLIPFTEHHWLIANDKLKAAGWVPRRTNEQAYVAGTEARWWTMLSPKRRQELALGGAGAVLATGGSVALVALRRILRTKRGASPR